MDSSSTTAMLAENRQHFPRCQREFLQPAVQAAGNAVPRWTRTPFCSCWYVGTRESSQRKWPQQIFSQPPQILAKETNYPCRSLFFSLFLSPKRDFPISTDLALGSCCSYRLIQFLLPSYTNPHGCSSVAVSKHQDQSNLDEKKFILAYSSREIGAHPGGEPWHHLGEGFNHGSEQQGWRKEQETKSTKLQMSQWYTSSNKATPLKPPNVHHLKSKSSNAQDCGRHFSFKSPQLPGLSNNDAKKATGMTT